MPKNDNATTAIIEEVFEALEFNPSETKVFLAILQVGPATITKITKAAGVTRTLGYHIIKKLEWYGVVTRVATPSGVAQFAAEHPRRLINLAKQKRIEWDRNQMELKDDMPLLLDMYHSKDRPETLFYNQPKKISQFYGQVLQTKTELLIVTDFSIYQRPEAKQFLGDYMRKKRKLPIETRMVVIETEKNKTFLETLDQNPKTKIRWIPGEELPGFSGHSRSMMVFDDSVMITHSHEYRPVSAQLITSPFVAHIQRSTFEILWTLSNKEK